MSLQDDFEHTIKEISKELGISQEKCRQVLLMAIKKLKKSRHLNEWTDIKDTAKEIHNANNL